MDPPPTFVISYHVRSTRKGNVFTDVFPSVHDGDPFPGQVKRRTVHPRRDQPGRDMKEGLVRLENSRPLPKQDWVGMGGRLRYVKGCWLKFLLMFSVLQYWLQDSSLPKKGNVLVRYLSLLMVYNMNIL